MQFLASVIDAIAWPVAVVWLGYLFRSEIRTLLSRFRQLRYGELEANFDKGLEAIEEEANRLLKQPEENGERDNEPVYPSPYDEKYAELLRIADTSSRAALVEAWVEVEASLMRAAERFNLDRGQGSASQKLVIGLINTGHYAKPVLPLFDGLRELRNKAVHVQQFEPHRRQIRRYIQIAIELALTFENPLYVDA